MKLHSLSDIITNSSETIFTVPSNKAVEQIKEVIDEVLIAAGSDKKWNDLFVIKEVLYREDFFAEMKFYNMLDCISEESTDEEIIEYIKSSYEEDRWMWGYVSIKIWTIDGEETKIPEKLLSLLYISSSYDY